MSFLSTLLDLFEPLPVAAPQSQLFEWHNHFGAAADYQVPAEQLYVSPSFDAGYSSDVT